MSSLEAKDAVSDYSELDATQRKTLDQWEAFFEKVSRKAGTAKSSDTTLWARSNYDASDFLPFFDWPMAL